VSDQTASLDEEIETLDRKLGQLKREFEQYFLGSRPREPVLLKAEVYKKVAFLSQQPIQNTALRFRFSSLCSRYQSMRRQWEEILRKIEAGTYERHQFKAQLHEKQRGVKPASPAAGARTVHRAARGRGLGRSAPADGGATAGATRGSRSNEARASAASWTSPQQSSHEKKCSSNASASDSPRRPPM